MPVLIKLIIKPHSIARAQSPVAQPMPKTVMPIPRTLQETVLDKDRNLVSFMLPPEAPASFSRGLLKSLKPLLALFSGSWVR